MSSHFCFWPPPFVLIGITLSITFLLGKKRTSVLRILGAIAIAILMPVGCLIREGLAQAAFMSALAANMHLVAVDCEIYAKGHGGNFPTNLAEVVRVPGAGISGGTFVYALSGTSPPSEGFFREPATASDDQYLDQHTDLLYLGRGLVLDSTNGTPPAVPVLRTKDIFWGKSYLVAFADGHVERRW